MHTTLAAALGAFLLLPLAGQAQSSRWETQVQAQLTRASDLLADRGYALSHEVKTGTLRDHENESFTLELDEDRSYALLGVCDEDCSDIDLRLFDQDGDEVDADVATDDYPVVEVRPRERGRYRVKVVMATCSTSPCFYGIGVFAK